MANKKITELNEATSVSNNDWLVIVDTANDETKKVHAGEVGGNIPIQDTPPTDPENDDLWIDTSEPEEMQEAIVNEYSESTSETYSCEYLNKLETYSTTEQRVGTWIDGKPIYRKVIRITLTATQQSTPINVNNVSKIISFDGVTNTGLPINFYFQPANTFISTFVDTNNIYNICSSGYSGNTADIILEYTKTTD